MHAQTHKDILKILWFKPEKVPDSALIQCDSGLVSCSVHQRAGRAASSHYEANQSQCTGPGLDVRLLHATSDIYSQTLLCEKTVVCIQ